MSPQSLKSPAAMGGARKLSVLLAAALVRGASRCLRWRRQRLDSTVDRPPRPTRRPRPAPPRARPARADPAERQERGKAANRAPTAQAAGARAPAAILRRLRLGRRRLLLRRLQGGGGNSGVAGSFHFAGKPTKHDHPAPVEGQRSEAFVTPGGDNSIQEYGDERAATNAIEPRCSRSPPSTGPWRRATGPKSAATTSPPATSNSSSCSPKKARS